MSNLLRHFFPLNGVATTATRVRSGQAGRAVVPKIDKVNNVPVVTSWGAWFYIGLDL